MDFSVAELTMILNWMMLIILALSLLLLVVWLLIQLLGRMASRKASLTDLDLIGHEARVTRSIRPPHVGRIVCTAGAKPVTFSATSAQRIAVGTVVLITAIDKGVARTIIKEAAAAVKDAGETKLSGDDQTTGETKLPGGGQTTGEMPDIAEMDTKT